MRTNTLVFAVPKVKCIKKKHGFEPCPEEKEAQNHSVKLVLIIWIGDLWSKNLYWVLNSLEILSAFEL